MYRCLSRKTSNVLKISPKKMTDKKKHRTKLTRFVEDSTKSRKKDEYIHHLLQLPSWLIQKLRRWLIVWRITRTAILKIWKEENIQAIHLVTTFRTLKRFKNLRIWDLKDNFEWSHLADYQNRWPFPLTWRLTACPLTFSHRNPQTLPMTLYD